MSEEKKLLEIHRSILSDVVVYVDVWHDGFYNLSDVFQEKLVDMGAKIAKKWSSKVWK